MKLKCKCGNLATWLYMPADECTESAFCDDCVPRGCSCNIYEVAFFGFPNGREELDWKWNDEAHICYEELDNGKQLPCCEYDYDKDGFDE